MMATRPQKAYVMPRTVRSAHAVRTEHEDIIATLYSRIKELQTRHDKEKKAMKIKHSTKTTELEKKIELFELFKTVSIDNKIVSIFIDQVKESMIESKVRIEELECAIRAKCAEISAVKRDDMIGENCSICLESLCQNHESLALLPCGHYYHNKCYLGGKSGYDKYKCAECRAVCIKIKIIESSPFLKRLYENYYSKEDLGKLKQMRTERDKLMEKIDSIEGKIKKFLSPAPVSKSTGRRDESDVEDEDDEDDNDFSEAEEDDDIEEAEDSD
jgi:hypothetical protein